MLRRWQWPLLVGGNVLFLLVLSFYQVTDAAPTMPFASGEQRGEMVAQLKEINAQLKELNALLKSGELKVIARPEEKKQGE